MIDINFGFLVSQIVHFAMLFAWVILGFRALKYLYHAKLTEGIRLLWVAIVLFVPLFGALAVLIVRPTEQRTELS
ncbi:MAG: hypothetical protein MUE54_06885 [Anaerolineae bacterium]|jgi:hypothetical protein|nr:hypothetical protein [Anaerolineae bacterium]